jgi:prophage antirepressor-like protein
MNTLIDLEKCREYMTVTIGGKEHQIKLAGTIEDPYFCGKDVCNILGYNNTKKALEIHTKPKYKKSLGSFVPKSYNETKAVYVNEPGLYSLIMHSKAPFAEEFQDMVYETILPSIRKYRSYQVETQLSSVMEQLSIKEDQLSEANEARVRAERKAIRVNKFMRRVTTKERKLEWIYIATTELYAFERIFKIGSTTRLSTRIGGYNTGRPTEDAYYYCWVTKCYNSKDVDYYIQKLLSEFKHRDNAELYCGIKFDDLKDIVEFIVNNYDASIDYINNFIKTRLDSSLEEEDQAPPRLDYKRITYQIGEYTETIDIEGEESESIKDAFEDILNSIKQQRSGPIVVQRKELVSQLLKVTNAPKKDIWNQIKSFTGWASSKTEIDEGSFKYKITY